MKKLIPTNSVLIPDYAKKVFEGVIFDVYQWPQTMFDGSIKTFEMLKRPDTVEVIAIHDGKMVVLEEEQPGKSAYYSLPSGRVDKTDKNLLEAAKRELLEETGLSFKNWKLIKVTQPFAKIEWFAFIFFAYDLENKQVHSPESDGEKITVLNKTLSEVLEMVKHPKNRYLPAELLEKLNSLDELKNLPEFSGKSVDR